MAHRRKGTRIVSTRRRVSKRHLWVDTILILLILVTFLGLYMPLARHVQDLLQRVSGLEDRCR